MDKENVFYTYNKTLGSLPILQHATTWMDLEEIRPSETSYTQKNKCFMPDYTSMRFLKY